MSDMTTRASKPIDPQQALSERRSKFIEHLITEWVVRRRAEDALTREELASLDGTQRIIAQKHSLLDNFAHLYRKNPCADVAPGCLLFVTVFADNNTGACMYSMERIAKFFSRSERAIRDAMHRLEDDGVMFRDKNGRSYACWPAVHRAFVSDRAHASWFVDALAPRNRKQPSGIEPNEYRKKTSGVAKRYRKSSAAIPEAGGIATSLIDFPKENTQKGEHQNFDEVRKSRLPDSAQLSNAGIAYAVSQRMTEKEAQESFEEFSDHHIANGTVKNNWDRAWKQWVRIAFRDGHMARKRGAAGQGAKGTAASPKSKGQRLGADDLLEPLAEKRNTTVDEIQWFADLADMVPKFESVNEAARYLDAVLHDLKASGDHLTWATREARQKAPPAKNGCRYRPEVGTIRAAAAWKHRKVSDPGGYHGYFDWEVGKVRKICG